MKIEVGKFYKTRDGRKVGPMQDDWPFEDVFCWHSNSGCLTNILWDKFGKNYKGYDADKDLIAEWNDTPEVGTLQEIGAKVGDVVSEYGAPAQEIVSYFPLADEPWTLKRLETGSVDTWYGDSKVWRIISRAQPKPEQTEPVRTVTRTTREIVPGQYGLVTIDDGTVRMDYFIPVEDDLQALTDAISVLTSIRDALKDNGE